MTRGIHTDTLLNYETVKYFGGEEHEGERYRQAIGEYQVTTFAFLNSPYAHSGTQELEYKVICLSFLAPHHLLLTLSSSLAQFFEPSSKLHHRRSFNSNHGGR